MAIQGTGISSDVSLTLICIDSFDNAELSGRLYNAFVPDKIDFYSVTDMLSKMESLYDRLSFPQASVRYRSFQSKSGRQVGTGIDQPRPTVKRFYEDAQLEEQAGTCASFLVRVSFRQNATWQGTLLWREENKTRTFSSTLDLIRFVAGATVGTACGHWKQ